MNSQLGRPGHDPTERFLVAAMSVLRNLMTPLYYATRTDMGVQYSALLPFLLWSSLHCVVFWILTRISEINLPGLASYVSKTSKIDAQVVALYAVLAGVGYVRNMLQARRRRRVRDWSVHRWSTGTSLLEPVFRLAARRICRVLGEGSWGRRKLSHLLNPDFIYYVAEPAMLLLAAGAVLWVESTLCFYPILLAIALIVIRNDAQLYLYLQAHEVVDGKKMEQAIKWQIEGPEPARFTAALAQIPPAPSNRVATDDQSVFNRLSPELQLLLVRDRAMQAPAPPAQ